MISVAERQVDAAALIVTRHFSLFTALKASRPTDLLGGG